MVIMDYFQGKTAHELWPGSSDQLPNKIFKEVWHVVKELHQIGLVFADLCKPNIMVNTINPPEVNMVDFDRYGMHDEERYPVTLNDNYNAIGWHPDVERNGIMSQDHDDWMLNHLY
jgi:RIO-like serine/threonine protein kinase